MSTQTVINGVTIPDTYTKVPDDGIRYADFTMSAEEMQTVVVYALATDKNVENVARDFIQEKFGSSLAKQHNTALSNAKVAAMASKLRDAWCESNNLHHPQEKILSEAFRTELNDTDIEEAIRDSYDLSKSEAKSNWDNRSKSDPNKSKANKTVSVARNKSNKKDISVSITKDKDKKTVENPSRTLKKSALDAVEDSDNQDIVSPVGSGVGAEVGLQKAATDAINAAKVNAQVAMNSGSAVDRYMAEARALAGEGIDISSDKKETLDTGFKQALSSAFLVSSDKGRQALADWSRSEQDLPIANLEEGMIYTRAEFPELARNGLWNTVDLQTPENAEERFEWDEYWDEKIESIKDEELLELYDQMCDEDIELSMDCYGPIIEEYIDEFESSSPDASGAYVNPNPTQTKRQNEINQKQSGSMDNAILDAISKYLPEKYRNVEYLLSIPNEILKEACDRLENELKVDDDAHLSTSDRERIMNIMWMAAGLGGYHNQLQTFMTALNRFGGTNVTPAAEHVGLTFITRPRLCLQSSNLRNNRIMTALDTLNNSTIAFAIRCLLDSNFGTANDGAYMHQVATSPIFDYQNPFLVPLCNALTSFNGSPDIDLQSTTTDGGYMSEAQTFAIGGSNLQRGTYNLTLNFQEASHNPVLAILFFWIEYIRCVTRGSMMAYADDIDAQRLNYTVSIYRFLLDPSHRYITKYAKYTGCFPTGLPIGSSFNFSPGDVEVEASKNISITFNCNKVEYMDYAILMDFNTLVKRYCPVINKAVRTESKTRDVTRTVKVPVIKRGQYNPVTGRYRDNTIEYVDRTEVIGQEQYLVRTDVDYDSSDENGYQNSRDILKCPALPIEALSNFRGLPYIVSDRNGFRLEFRQHPSPAFHNESTTLADQLLYLDMIHRLDRELASYETASSFYTPEYASKANAYKNVDLGDFIRRAFNSSASASLNTAIL